MMKKITDQHIFALGSTGNTIFRYTRVITQPEMMQETYDYIKENKPFSSLYEVVFKESPMISKESNEVMLDSVNLGYLIYPHWQYTHENRNECDTLKKLEEVIDNLISLGIDKEYFEIIIRSMLPDFSTFAIDILSNSDYLYTGCYQLNEDLESIKLKLQLNCIALGIANKINNYLNSRIERVRK